MKSDLLWETEETEWKTKFPSILSLVRVMIWEIRFMLSHEYLLPEEMDDL